MRSPQTRMAMALLMFGSAQAQAQDGAVTGWPQQRFAITKSWIGGSCPPFPRLVDQVVSVARSPDGTRIRIDDGNGRFEGAASADGSFRSGVRSGEMAGGRRLDVTLHGHADDAAFEAVLHGEMSATTDAGACSYDIRWSGQPVANAEVTVSGR